MSGLQEFTNPALVTPKRDKSLDIPQGLTPIQNEYVSYVAVSGLMIDDDGSVRQMKVDEFCEAANVTRTTLQHWRQRIPNFSQLVETRRAQLFPGSRISAIWKAMQLKAMGGNTEAAKIVLGHFGQWQPPSQKHEVQIGGLIDLAKIAQSKGVIDGEVINGDHP